jgi:hypothetical protein
MCIAPPSTFGALQPLVPPAPVPWNLGPGPSGTSIIETYLPFTPESRLSRLAVFTSGDALTTTAPGGANTPILIAFDAVIPTVGEWGLLILALLLAGGAWHFLRRDQRIAFLVCLLFAAGAGAAWAASIVLDGDGSDWTASATARPTSSTSTHASRRPTSTSASTRCCSSRRW